MDNGDFGEVGEVREESETCRIRLIYKGGRPNGR